LEQRFDTKISVKKLEQVRDQLVKLPTAMRKRMRTLVENFEGHSADQDATVGPPSHDSEEA